MFAPGIWATAHEHIFHAGEGPCPFASMLCGLLQNGNLRTLGGYPTFPANFAQEQGLSPKIEEASERKNLKSRSELVLPIHQRSLRFPLTRFSKFDTKDGTNRCALKGGDTQRRGEFD